MSSRPRWRPHWTCAIVALVIGTGAATAQEAPPVDRLVAAVLGNTPMERDLRELTDGVGGRPTGSDANLRAVDWAVEKLRSAGVSVSKEPFMMPELWLESKAEAEVMSPVRFRPGVAAMPFSIGTTPEGISAPVRDGGRGDREDFERLGARASGAWVMIETTELKDVPGLFEEYARSPGVERLAFAAGAAGVIYMGSRPRNQLYRHNASLGTDNEKPLVVMERDAAARILRLIRNGEEVTLNLRLQIQSSGPYESYNVIGEIPGVSAPEEVVVAAAHLDSWDLGTGALDNGANVVMLIDIARQMERLGIRPQRTIRFALFNGEEQGLIGSWRYTQAHMDELDDHVMASSFDIGTGRILGFFTGGRPEAVAAVQRALAPVEGLGPFQHLDVPVVGTDNYDFMMQGVLNLVANQASANYGPNYHARSDTFDKVDLRQLRLNEAVVAAVILRFADMDVTWNRHTREEIEQLITRTDLEAQMKTFGLWQPWISGERGRLPQ